MAVNVLLFMIYVLFYYVVYGIYSMPYKPIYLYFLLLSYERRLFST